MYAKKRPPVRKGKVYSVYIRDTSKRGDGVGKIEDFAVFVPGAREGETVMVKIIEIKKNCAVGKIVAKEDYERQAKPEEECACY
jgi:23S rRNA (uracil1939-C5)-methyltransferase